MNCHHCGKPLESEAKFCTYCGVKIAEQTETGPDQSAAAAEQPSASTKTPITENPYVKQGKQISRQYFRFAGECLKFPAKKGETVESPHFINGVITILLFSLFLPLTGYLTLKNALSNPFFGSVPIPFSSTVLQPFLYLILFFACLTGIMFVVAKLMKVDADYKDVTARFGAFLTIPAAFVILGFLLSLINVVFFTLVLVALGFSTLSLAIFFTIYSFQKNRKEGLDAFYGVLITLLLVGILFYIFGESFTNRLLEQLSFLSSF